MRLTSTAAPLLASFATHFDGCSSLGSSQRLGPHVDNATLTLLWATEPGLQVPVPGSIRPDQVAGFGFPSLTGEFVFLREDQWVTVPSTPDDIVLTLGLEFFTAFSDVAERAKILSPALHRVKRAGTNSKTTRLR